MKVLILDSNGVQKSVEAKNVEVQGKTLIDWIRENEKFKSDINSFISKFETRENLLHELWGKLR